MSNGTLTTLVETPKMWTKDHFVQPPGPTVLLTILVTDMTPSPMIINVSRPIRTLRCVSSNPIPGVQLETPMMTSVSIANNPNQTVHARLRAPLPLSPKTKYSCYCHQNINHPETYTPALQPARTYPTKDDAQDRENRHDDGHALRRRPELLVDISDVYRILYGQHHPAARQHEGQSLKRPHVLVADMRGETGSRGGEADHRSELHGLAYPFEYRVAGEADVEERHLEPGEPDHPEEADVGP